jgi:hypothetical protein
VGGLRAIFSERGDKWRDWGMGFWIVDGVLAIGFFLKLGKGCKGVWSELVFLMSDMVWIDEKGMGMWEMWRFV